MIFNLSKDLMVVSCCGTRHLPRHKAIVSCRPLPLAPLPSPATGGGRVAPLLIKEKRPWMTQGRKKFRGTTLILVNAQATPLHFLQAENSACGLASPLPHKGHPPLRGPFQVEEKDDSQRFNGRTRNRLPIDGSAPRPCSTVFPVPPLTCRGSLTGYPDVLFFSQLFSVSLPL